MALTGTVREIQGEMRYEWEIKDFLRLIDKFRYQYVSPGFSFYGVTWRIRIYLFSEKSVGYVSLFLDTMSISKPVTVNVSLSLKSVERKNDTEMTFTHIFNQEKNSLGWAKFILRSDLIARKAELLPSGNLTVICTLKNNKSAATGVSVLQQQFKEILQTGNVSDVVLKVEGQEYKTHRCVLAARSPVFLAMLTHDTKEKDTGVVDIQDVDPKMFFDFLRYLYTGSEEIITSENVVELYTAADKYQVDELKKSCLDYMLTNITVDNFCDILSLSLVHREKSLTYACCKFFIENSLPIAETSKWLMFATKNPVTANQLHIKYMKSNITIRD